MEVWGSLSEDFALCSGGRAQSPIDLYQPIVASVPSPQFFYQPSQLRLINNGRTIQVNYDRGSYMMLDGDHYDLIQFHFHHPSEHRIDSTSYPMELHLVHRHSSGKLGVVGVFLTAGLSNDLIEQLWSQIPKEIDRESYFSDIEIDAGKLLPHDSSFYHYFGSLTTPPCSEGVRWMVSDQPITLSPAQLTKFQQLFPPNARSPQPVNDRFLIKSP